jgi:hypothetical protein
MASEKRNATRLSVDDGAFAAIGESYDVVGRIKDISTTGLSVEYLSNKDLESTETTIAVFSSGNGFYLPNLKGRVVYSCNLKSRRPTSYAMNLKSKRCGIQLLELSKNQRRLMDQFIKTYSHIEIVES